MKRSCWVIAAGVLVAAWAYVIFGVRTSRQDIVWRATFSYAIARGEPGERPFRLGNERWAETFASDGFRHRVADACLKADDPPGGDVRMIRESVSNATFEVVGGGEKGIVCRFSVCAHSESVAAMVAGSYLDVMQEELCSANERILRLATMQLEDEQSRIAAKLRNGDASCEVKSRHAVLCDKITRARADASGMLERLVVVQGVKVEQIDCRQ